MSLYPRKKAILALSDGTVVHGWAVGHEGITGGELCFNTSMTGYQEIFTDPSYHGQLMMMTYPHIGNYGTMARDDEARKVMVAGIITRAFSWEFRNLLMFMPPVAPVKYPKNSFAAPGELNILSIVFLLFKGLPLS